MSEWKKYKLENLVIFIDGDRGKNYPKQDEYLEKGYCLFLNTSNVTKEGFNFSKVNYISESKDKLLRNGRLEFDDIILTTRGTIGNLALYREYMYYPMRINSSMLILKTKEVLTSEFLYYLLKTQSMQFHMRLFSSGSAQPQLPVKDLKKIEVMIPSRKVQDEIVSILSNYDKLIENNNRRIQILEQTAEELYKEWFVRMRFPGYENAKFHKGIPEEWEIKKVEEIISFDIGGGWGEESLMNDFTEQAYVIRGTDIPNMKYGEFNYELLRYHKKSNLKSRKLESTDIIFEASGGSKDQRLGRTFYVTEEILSMYDNDVICASFCKLIKFEDKYLSWFFYNYLRYAYQTEILSTFEVQSTGISNFGFSKFKKHHQLLVPTSNVMEQFYKLTYPMLLEMQKLGNKNQNLIKQRDLLLPRLMNGTITVK